MVNESASFFRRIRFFGISICALALPSLLFSHRGISTDGKAGAWRHQFTMFGNGSPRSAMIAIFAAVSRSVLTDLGLAEAM